MARKRKKLDSNTLEVTGDPPVNNLTRASILQNLEGLRKERAVYDEKIAEAEGDLAALD